MGDHFSVQTAEFTKARSRRSRWHKVLAVLAAVVVFCTTYALILPAITKEQPVYCGYTDKHTDDCYEEIRTLTCTIKSLSTILAEASAQLNGCRLPRRNAARSDAE